jgi:hypothetical protein
MVRDVKIKQRIKIKDVTLTNKRVTINKRINYDKLDKLLELQE